MWVDKKIAFIGGDARQLEIIAEAVRLGAEVVVYGFQDFNLPLQGVSQVGLECPIWDSLDILVLPITGIESGGRVSSKFREAPIVLPVEFWSRIPRGCLVFTGITKPYLAELAVKFEWQLIALMDLDEVAILNSIPSAEGAIAMAMENTSITIHGSNCAVLGFGRCGSTLSRMLLGLGAKVSVAARKAPDLARIREMGATPFRFDEMSNRLKAMDIIFNTVPVVILTREILETLSRDTVIIDIASSPGGVDFQSAEEIGINAILAPSLPGIVAPRTAGQILAETIVRIVG